MDNNLILQYYSYYIILPILFPFIIDFIIGDPETKIHPVRIMGSLFEHIKKKIVNHSKICERILGLLMILTIILIFSIFSIIGIYCCWVLTSNIIPENNEYSIISIILFSILNGFLLKWSFAIKYLGSVTKSIENSLVNTKSENAKLKLSYIVRRKTGELDEQHIISATVEVIAESSTDSVISVLFYYFIGGFMGIICIHIWKNPYFIFLSTIFAYTFRIINTGDSIVGYKDVKNINLGWASAKLDDIANFIPARMTAFFMLIIGKFYGLNYKQGKKILKRDRNVLESINAGWTMGTMAGLLNVQLEKINSYQLGDNNRPLIPKDISTTYNLIKMVVIIYLFLNIILFLLI